MNDTLKHWFDAVMLILASVGMALNSVVAFLASASALVWYGIRIYDWWKGRQIGNV